MVPDLVKDTNDQLLSRSLYAFNTNLKILLTSFQQHHTAISTDLHLINSIRIDQSNTLKFYCCTVYIILHKYSSLHIHKFGLIVKNYKSAACMAYNKPRIRMQVNIQACKHWYKNKQNTLDYQSITYV